MSVLQYLKSGDGNFGAQAPRCLSACGSGQRDGERRCRSYRGAGGYAVRIRMEYENAENMRVCWPDLGAIAQDYGAEGRRKRCRE